jgi:hypothetical protein
MVDRHDIDALLIGSLYGELSSADEARLKAHLESHPADRAALDGLAHAREAVRASRIFEVQAEPSQAVSALLLQEAARRAPRMVRRDDAGEGWFARLRRSFLVHPAFAAAAMLVVVVGVAGTLYVRQGDHFAAPDTSAPAMQAEESAFAQAPAPPPPAPASAPDTVTATAVPAADTVEPTGDGRRDADSSYRVGLAEGKSSRRPEAQAKLDAAPAKPTPAPAPAKAELAKRARQTGPGSLLEVSTPQRAPKEYEDVRAEKTAAAAPAADKGRAPSRAFARPADEAPAMEPAMESAIAAKEDRAQAGRAPSAAPNAPVAAAAPAVAQDLSKARGATGGAASGSTAPGGGGAIDPDFAWAKEQHSRLVTQVKAGRCSDAADTALALSSRVPGYYQQNVESDRAVKSCLAYITAERERAADRAQRARATTRRVTDEDAAASKSVEAPRKAAPAKAKAPPAKAPAKAASPAKADDAAPKRD